MTLQIVSPFDETPKAIAEIAPRLVALEGSTIGLLDISKPRGAVFLNRIEDLLIELFGVEKVIRYTKPTFARNAPEELTDRILRDQCQGVIEALAD